MNHDIINSLHEQEVLYRRRGAFNSAVQCQRAADYLSSPDAVSGRNMCCWFDRGIDRRPYWHINEHLLGLDLPNDLVWFLPRDAQLELWIVLTHVLKLTSDDLYEAGFQLHLGEKQVAKQTQQEESTP
jgi:hypothetical protein